ncbi:MAG TPA: hypothetical protein VG735_03395, partial [Caulobacterales bacterium]|nr:hypothetical protein [Caulobacterales bacterium]
DNPRSKGRAYVDNTKAIAGLADMGQFSRKFWGLFSLELWHQQFHDRAGEYRRLAKGAEKTANV